MATKKKKKRILVKMTHPESNHVYFTTKNKTATPEKLTFNKYAPDLRRRVAFKEAK